MNSDQQLKLRAVTLRLMEGAVSLQDPHGGFTRPKGTSLTWATPLLLSYPYYYLQSWRSLRTSGFEDQELNLDHEIFLAYHFFLLLKIFVLGIQPLLGDLMKLVQILGCACKISVSGINAKYFHSFGVFSDQKQTNMFKWKKNRS